MALTTLVVLYQGWTVQQAENQRLATAIERLKRETQQLTSQNRELATKLSEQIVAADQRLKAMEQDYAAIQSRLTPWSPVLQVLLDARPQGMLLESIVQAQNTISLTGKAPDYASMVSYGQALVRSNLFSEVGLPSVELVGILTTTVAPTPSPPGQPIPGLVPPSPTPSPIPPPPPPPVPTATPVPPGFVDYKVAKKDVTAFPDRIDRYRVIKGRIIDRTGQLIPGLRVRLTSCCPPWSAEYPPAGQQATGTFEFLVAKGTFALTIENVRAEPATNLTTEGVGFIGYYVWEVIFQKQEGSTTDTTPTPSPRLAPSGTAPTSSPRLPTLLPAVREVRPPLSSGDLAAVGLLTLERGLLRGLSPVFAPRSPPRRGSAAEITVADEPIAARPEQPTLAEGAQTRVSFTMFLRIREQAGTT